MKSFGTCKEAATAIYLLYYDELKNIQGLQELSEVAIKYIELEVPDSSIEEMAYITNEIVILYERNM